MGPVCLASALKKRGVTHRHDAPWPFGCGVPSGPRHYTPHSSDCSGYIVSKDLYMTYWNQIEAQGERIVDALGRQAETLQPKEESSVGQAQPFGVAIAGPASANAPQMNLQR